MRSEREMMDLIINVAKKDDRIRAVVMNGSRTNSKAPLDPFQDFDIVYLLIDLQSFIIEPNWSSIFGEKIIMQTPDTMSMFPSEEDGSFAYLMLFTDGNRIDLTLEPIENMDPYCYEDKLTIPLLDKDQRLPIIPQPTDEDYWVKRPSAEFFGDCCNEFWWVSTYVAKGLWRKEILYAQDHMNIVRSMLLKMLEWQVGLDTNFSVSVGKNGKYLEQYLDEIQWIRLMETYPSGTYQSVWKSLTIMTELFQETAISTGKALGYHYNFKEASKVKQYLNHVQNLPADAKEVY